MYGLKTPGTTGKSDSVNVWDLMKRYAFIKSKAVFQPLLQTGAKLSPKGIQRKTMDRKPWWPQNEHVKGIHFPLPWKGLAIGEWFCLDIWMRSTSTPRRIKKRKSCNNGIWVKTEPVILLFSYAIFHLLLFENAKSCVYGYLMIT